MRKRTYIYALLDPDSKDVKYIGKTDHPGKRLKNHLQPHALEIRCRRTSWLKGLLNKGKTPVMAIIEEVDDEVWKQRECYWIAFYRGLGVNLMNTAEGGTGGVKSEWVTAEMRENMSKAQLGHVRSEASRKKQGDSIRGRKRGEEFSTKMSQVNKGKKPSEATRKAQLLAITGAKQSLETIAKRMVKAKGNKHAVKHRYVAIDANGKEYQVDLLSSFCKEYGLHPGKMNALANGDQQRKQHKGWTCRFAE